MNDSVRLKVDHSPLDKLRLINWGLVGLLTILAMVGWTALYSAAGGSLDPWAYKQMVRFGLGLFILVVLAMVDVRWWHRLSYPFYAAGFILLIVVEFMGRVGMGAQRWIDLGFIQLQPTELMKIALVMALARYFHSASAEDLKSIPFLIPPALMILAPVGLIMVQPDLGASLMLVFVGAAMFFVAGATIWLFIGGIALTAAAIPIAWQFLHEFQKNRIKIFLNPESDPLGAGYHITQSKIALGSGGIDGKGFMNGSQSRLNFLPEKQTDFIFTLWAEEFGLVGGLFLLAVFGLVFLYGWWIAIRCRHSYGRLLAYGLIFNFAVYVFINVSMVMGLIPVVGEPLPLVSYGGTSMLAVMAAFGLIISCNIHRDSKLPR